HAKKDYHSGFVSKIPAIHWLYPEWYLFRLSSPDNWDTSYRRRFRVYDNHRYRCTAPQPVRFPFRERNPSGFLFRVLSYQVHSVVVYLWVAAELFSPD